MGNAVRMRLLGWGLIQSDRCPYKKRLGHEKRPQEACDGAAKVTICKPMREASGECNLADILILDFWPLELWEIDRKTHV